MKKEKQGEEQMGKVECKVNKGQEKRESENSGTVLVWSDETR